MLAFKKSQFHGVPSFLVRYRRTYGFDLTTKHFLVFGNDTVYSAKRCANVFEQSTINDKFHCNIIEMPKTAEDLPYCSPLNTTMIHGL